MSSTVPATEFFVAGGTLGAGVPSYVEREADDELLKHVIAGDFCRVLTPRQMGKSSLMVRTVERLKERGIRSVVIDLTAGGTANVTSEQWYLGLIQKIRAQLKLRVNPEQWWRQNAGIDAVQRFSNFLRQVVLEEVDDKVVIFIDEIDSTLSLEFNTDDFFAAIRAVYNARPYDSKYKHLTFVLLGTVTPSDLIQDPKRTPFNIGSSIALQEFSPDDAEILRKKLEEIHPQSGRTIFQRIFYWTAGHPYLTQRLCLTVVEDFPSASSEQDIDAVVEGLLLAPEAVKKEDNLQSIQNVISVDSHKLGLLRLYRNIIAGKKPIKTNLRDQLQNKLKLIGLVKDVNGVLESRNRIYRHVFDEKWIARNWPVERLRIYAIASSLSLLLMLGGYIGPILLDLDTPWHQSAKTFAAQQLTVQVNTLEALFLRDDSAADTRLTTINQLIKLGASDLAKSLILEQLPPEKRVELFKNADLASLERPALEAVMKLIYDSLDNNVRLALLANLFRTAKYKTYAEELLQQIPLSEQIGLFRQADIIESGDDVFTILSATVHSADANMRLVAFARLFKTEAQKAQAIKLFFEEQTQEEQSKLFTAADPHQVGEEMLNTANAVYPHFANTQAENEILAEIGQSLQIIHMAEAESLAQVIEQWLKGRNAYRDANYATAITLFNSVIDFNLKNATAYYDRGLSHKDLKQYEDALRDFNTSLATNQTNQALIQSKLASDSALAETFSHQISRYPALAERIINFNVNSVIAIQAVSNQETNTLVDSYDDKGKIVCSRAVKLIRGQSLRGDMGSFGQCPLGSLFHIVASANQPLATLVIHELQMDLGDVKILKKAGAPGVDHPIKETFYSTVGIEPNTWGYLRIGTQNYLTKPVDITYQLLNPDGSILKQFTHLISANGGEQIKFVRVYESQSRESDSPNEFNIPFNWSGGLKIAAQEDTIVTAAVGCSGGICAAIEDQLHHSQRWFAPGLRSSQPGDDPFAAYSIISIMNTSEKLSTTVHVNFQQITDEITITLPPLGSTAISLRYFPNGMAQDSTAEILSDDTPVVVDVQYIDRAHDQGEIYHAVASTQGGSQLYFPDLSWMSEQLDTDLYLQNVTNRVITPTITLSEHIKDSKEPIASPMIIQLNPVQAYQTLQVDVGNLITKSGLSQWEGSAVVTTTSQMAGIALIRANGDEQWAIAYNATER